MNALCTTDSQAERLRQIYYKESVWLQSQVGTKRSGFEALPSARNYRSCAKASPALLCDETRNPACRPVC